MLVTSSLIAMYQIYLAVVTTRLIKKLKIKKSV